MNYRFILIILNAYWSLLRQSTWFWNWKDRWKIARKGRYYAQFNQTLSFQIKEYLKSADRLSFSTFTQMKLGHEYFKAYLHQLSDYDSKKCHGICVRDQTSEHLLTACQHFKKEQTELKNQLRKANLPYTAKVYSRRNKSCFTVFKED